MFHIVPQQARTRIRGMFHPGPSSISIDVGSFLFEGDTPVKFHEITHYYLTKFTNFGTVYGIIVEMLHQRRPLIVDPNVLQKTAQTLHISMYAAQEGFAHVMQARVIYKDGGLEAAKAFEDNLPHERKAILAHCRDFIKFEQQDFDKFIGRFTHLALDTALPEDFLKDSSLLIDEKKLADYLSVAPNNPNERYEALCRAVARQPQLIHASEQEICKAAGIDFVPPMPKLLRAQLINGITGSFTTEPSALTENDIGVLTGTDALTPAFEGMMFADTNILADARTNLSEGEIFGELPFMRTLLIYNYGNSVRAGQIPFFSFSRERRIINGIVTDTPEARTKLISSHLTQVIDAFTIDYKTNVLKPERSFLTPDIVWYKSYLDIKIFLDMLNELKIEAKVATIQFTEGHDLALYLIRIAGERHLHFLVSMPFVLGKLLSCPFIKRVEGKDALWELIGGSGKHINNFLHDIVGVPYLMDFVAMTNDPEKHLDLALEVKEYGMGRNDKCICGSEKKYKKCHGA